MKTLNKRHLLPLALSAALILGAGSSLAAVGDEYDPLISLSSDATGSDSYTLVTLSKGQTMYLNVGCELMLRVGSAAVNAATSPALIDITTGPSTTAPS